jgi:hypothetical protein
MDNSVLVPRAQLRRLGDELSGALRAVTQARGSSDAFEVLTQVTMAIEELTATQHELVNVLLDNGHSWGEVADALSTSAAAAERRYPRRTRREGEPSR